MKKIDLFSDYDNSKLDNVESFRACHKDKTFKFSEIGNKDINGIPVALTRDKNDELEVSFIPDNHVLAIGATRSGKTTGFVIPAVNIFARRKNKPNIVISDPKQELYKSTGKLFEKMGYEIIVLDFIDNNVKHCWNPLAKFYRQYKAYLDIEKNIKTEKSDGKIYFNLNGKRYENEIELIKAVKSLKEDYLSEIEMGIMKFAYSIVPPTRTDDTYWNDAARDMFRAIVYGMLEDIDKTILSESDFNFDMILKISDSFNKGGMNFDNGYFTSRPENSKAYNLAKNIILYQAEKTRFCIVSVFASRVNMFRDTVIRKITSKNTFEIKDFDEGAPKVIFVTYKDEEGSQYEIISMFLSDLYTELINLSRKKGGKLSRPFYFMLDEFGNLPKFKDFDKVISACGSRNIWLILVLQSYAQLYNIYGRETAEIIKDNLNTHIFFGTNNPVTKEEFSAECGRKIVLSPESALNGQGEYIERYEKESVPLVPVSKLNTIKEGYCYVTQMRENVVLSYIERSYKCREFDN